MNELKKNFEGCRNRLGTHIHGFGGHMNMFGGGITWDYSLVVRITCSDSNILGEKNVI